MAYLNANIPTLTCYIRNEFMFNHEKGHGCPKCVRVSSRVQIQWLEYISKLYNLHIQHAMNDSEYTISTTKCCK